jgi:Tol biopolymer transport system component
MLKRSPRPALLVPAVIAFLALTASFAQALPATAPDDTGMVNGPVRAITQAGNLLWVGGAFDQVLDQQGNNLEAASNLAVFDANTGVAVTSIALPLVTWAMGEATVYDMSLSPDGTLYFAGNFDAVNGVTRYNVAAINAATGALLPFAPHTEGSQGIYANGAVVYVGGSYLRAFRPNGTGLGGWTPPQAWISPTLRGHTTYAMFRDIVQVGGTLVAACVCDKVFDASHPSPDGVSVKAVVEIDAITGTLRSWSPSNLPLGPSGSAAFGESVIVHAAPDTGLTTVYLGAGGNDFTAAYDFQTGQQIWKTDTSGSSQVVLWHQGTLIVGGHFEWTQSPTTSGCGDNDHPVTTCYGTPKLTAMNPVDGSVVIDPATSQPWNPAICCKYNGVWALVVNENDSTLWVGGEFTRVGGTWTYDAGTNAWTQAHGLKQWYFAQLAAPVATVHPLSVVSADIGTGVGSVTSDVGGINCGSICAADFADATVVTLTATPAAGFAFLGWAGDCAGTTSPCQVTMDRARHVTASFGVPTYPLTAAHTGAGNGKVKSDIGGINCGTNANTTACSVNIVTGSSVVLTPTATAGSIFTGWGGDCAGNDLALPCVLTMDQAHSVSVNFEIAKNVIVNLAGAGGGQVTSSPSGVNCPTTCMVPYASGTVITLTATPDANSTFAGWGPTVPANLCSGTGTCQLTLSGQRTVTATFAPILHQLSASRDGDGGGGVASDVGGIDCGLTCSVAIQQGRLVTLTATADGGSIFTGWTGDCSGSLTTCQITMDTDHAVTATFKTLYALTVTPDGTGGGLVTSDSGLIDCGSTCADQYASGTIITLMAAPDAASSFDGWGGDCSGTDPCQVTTDQMRNVTATFTHVFHQLTVTPLGAGTGSITSDPAAIDCGATCEAAVLQATEVTLTAVAAPGDTFMGWGGECSGILTCVLTMDGDHSVTATFTPAYDLSITNVGGGDGTVTSGPEGIDCGPTCTWGFLDGTVVTLTALPDAGSSFAGWTGDCVGSDTTCEITVDAIRGVTATFDPVYHQLTVFPAGDGSGSVTSDVGGIDCGLTCSVPVRQPTVLTLTVAEAPGSIFTGWSGDCAGTQATCQLTMDGDHSATATFMSLFQLDVNRAGLGAGSISADIGAIDCGATCSDIYTSGTAVTLTASPDANSTFTGWSGDATCPGTGTCQVTMSQARTVTAIFAQIPRQLFVTKIGSGGTVTSSPSGVDCGGTCVASFPQPTVVDLTATPSVGWFFSGWAGDCSGTGACQVTMDQDHAVSATFTQGAGCGKILFTTKRTANVDIWVMNGNGTSQTRLTNNAGSDMQPSWSPDCARIAFVSSRTGSDQVFVMNANGTGQTQLTSSGDNNQPTWAPDGSKIAFVSSRTGTQKIWVMNANGTGQTMISDTSNVSDTHPDWSPNGAKIVFTSSRTGGNQVWVMNANGTGPLRLIKTLKAVVDAAWSPDGTKVALVSKFSGARQVWTVNVNANGVGSGAVQVSFSGKTDSQPTWSPDGTKIAFSTTTSGHGQIWVVNANGTNPVNISNSASRDTLPNWS